MTAPAAPPPNVRELVLAMARAGVRDMLASEQFAPLFRRKLEHHADVAAACSVVSMAVLARQVDPKAGGDILGRDRCWQELISVCLVERLLAERESLLQELADARAQLELRPVDWRPR